MTRPGYDGPSVTVERACELLHCSRARVFELLKEGRLQRAVRLGRQTTIITASVLAMATLPPRPEPKKRRTRKTRMLEAMRALPLDGHTS